MLLKELPELIPVHLVKLKVPENVLIQLCSDEQKPCTEGYLVSMMDTIFISPVLEGNRPLYLIGDENFDFKSVLDWEVIPNQNILVKPY